MPDTSPNAFTTFGDLLKHLRQRTQLTQEEFGLAVGYSRAHVARLEGNQRTPEVGAVRARFVKALHLQDKPLLAARLIELAIAAHAPLAADALAEPEAAPAQHPPNNLPVSLTRFIGRTRELRELERLLPTTRLLTLTGAGGTGKTRLALELAARVLHREADAYADAYADGVWLAELAGLSDPTALPQMLIALLGLHEDVRRPALATLMDGLRDKRLLLILDNCEHLIDACAHLVETVLRSSPGVRILTTSRETLGVPGELVWRVPSLQTPDLKAPLGVPELADYEAVRLFVDRATLTAPGFELELSSSNATAVQQICARLDGIPLAIELAAAQLKVMSAEEITARLNDHLRLLKGGSRTALPRQRTLRAAIDWSYQLLTEPERKLLQRLSVLAGDWALEAAEYIYQDDGIASQEGDVVELLTRLLDKSLVVMSERESRGDGVRGDGATWYHLHEMVRQYAAEKLANADAGESSATRDRHLDYFMILGERERSLLLGGIPVDQVSVLKSLERNLDNIRRAGEWAEQTGQIEKGLRLIMATGLVFLVRAGQKENITRLQTLLKHPSAAQNTRVEALAYLRIASVQLRQSEPEQCSASLEKAEAVTLTPDDPRIRADILSMRVDCAQQMGDYALARSYLDQWRAFALSHNRLGLDPESFAAEIAFLFGHLSLFTGDYAQAKACFAQVYEQARKTGDKIGTSCWARYLGYASLYSGEVAEAAEWFRESLTDNFALGDTLAVAACMAACGAYALAQGALHPAARLLGASERCQASLTTPLLPWDAKQVERNVATLRRQLAPAELEASWLAGRAMTLDQAVAYALETVPGPA